MNKRLFFGSSVTLIVGSLIYLLFRSQSLKMFRWLDTIACFEVTQSIRSVTLKIVEEIPDWILYSLPDGLWLSSYVCLVLLIWKNKINNESAVWIFGMPMIAIMSEVGQFFKIIPGTFDWMDVIMYLLGTAFPLEIYRRTRTNNLK